MKKRDSVPKVKIKQSHLPRRNVEKKRRKPTDVQKARKTKNRQKISSASSITRWDTLRASARAKDAKKLTSAMTRHMIVHLWQKMEVARSARRARGRRRPTNKSRKLLETDQGDVWLTDRRIKAYDLQTRVAHRVSGDHIKNGGTVALGDDEQCDIVGEGTAFIEKFVDGEWREARVENVPKLKKNLFSVGVY